MPVAYANVPNIHIDESVGGFAQVTITALDRIWGSGTGRRLLLGIAASAAPVSQFTDHALVLIKRPQTEDAVTKLKRPLLAAEGGNRAVPVNVVLAEGGGGCASAVFFNPEVTEVPGQGARPPFIGLAHELIHAWHNAMGTKQPSVDSEEEFTVGLGAWARPDPNLITENRIRLDFDVPIRHRY